jgi:hypothetical protein
VLTEVPLHGQDADSHAEKSSAAPEVHRRAGRFGSSAVASGVQLKETLVRLRFHPYNPRIVE